MKVGFSFGRCVGSIVRGEVKIEDVVCIVGRTMMTTDNHVEEVIREYHNYGYLEGLDLQTCLDVGLTLYTSGKVHQPRTFGTNIPPGAVEQEYIWMDLYPTATVHSDSVRNAWDTYRMLLNLTESVPENPKITL